MENISETHPVTLQDANYYTPNTLVDNIAREARQGWQNAVLKSNSTGRQILFKGIQSVGCNEKKKNG